MTVDVYLSDISVALGEIEACVATAESEGRLISRGDDLRAAGFDRHHRAAPTTSAYDLAVSAVDAIALALGSIDAIFYATALPANANLGSAADFESSRDVIHCMDFPASRLQAHFGLRDAAIIGICQQACTGILGALRLGCALLRSEPEVMRVLCVTADRFPAGARHEQAFNLISDGAAACVLSRHPAGFKVLAHHHITNGGQALMTAEETAGAFFPYMHRLVTESLRRAGLSVADIAWVVTQNIHQQAFMVLANLLGIPGDRFCSPTLAQIGHVISSDCLANLSRLEQQGQLQRGDRILLVMAGYGSNWQSLLLERA